MQSYDFHGIIACVKQLDDDPFGMGIDNDDDKRREGAWAKCSACGRLKTKTAFSSKQMRYGSTRRY